MTADPVMSRIFTYFDEQHSAKPPGDIGRVGVSWVRRQEESKELSEGKTHEYILEHLRTNPSVLAMIDFYSDENLAARVTSLKNVHEAAGVILSKLNVPLDNQYFFQLLALVYGMHFNRLKADEQEAEIKKYDLVSGLIKKMNDLLEMEDPHQKHESLKLSLSELKNLHPAGVEQLAIDRQFNKWVSGLQQKKHEQEMEIVKDSQFVYDFFYDGQIIFGLFVVAFATNLYLFRSEMLTFKNRVKIAGWTVYSSGLAWCGLCILGMVVKKMVRIMTPVFRHYVPAPKPPLHPLSVSMNQFIKAKLPKCYQAQLPQLTAKWKDAVLAKYFKPESSPALH
jgi:hypothetical protein